MRKGNLVFASRWFILQQITNTCKASFQGSLACTKILARSFSEVHGGSTSLMEEFEGMLKSEGQGMKTSTDSMTTCIYRVPSTMRRVNRKAFDPSIVSIGPYHHGDERLQEMEKLKRMYFQRLFQQRSNDQVDAEVVVLRKNKAVDDVVKAMEELEADARGCYSEQSKVSSKEFVKMMLMDGCFIVGLLKDSFLQPDFEHTPSIIQRWMLPTLRRDLIKLENQLPLFVLRKLFQLTEESSGFHEKSTVVWELEALALRFFKPLLRGHDDDPKKPLQHYAPESCQCSSSKHFLDLFHNRISPDCSTSPPEQARGNQTKQIQAIQQLKEAGIKFTTDPARGALDITFGRSSWFWGKVLTIPQIHIADHKGTLFRNLVAFEKCYPNCNQDVTSYLFFIDSLINSAKDVGLLQYHGILHHSLGSNREVAKLVNNLCKEISPNVCKSYLHNVVKDINNYYGSKYGKIRGFLVHHHFSSWLVGISTIAACLALYLALVQTGCSVATSRERLDEHSTFGDFLKESLLYPHIFRWGSFWKSEDLQETLDNSITYGASAQYSLFLDKIFRWGSFRNVASSLRQHFESLLVSINTKNEAHDRCHMKSCEEAMFNGCAKEMQYCVYHLA